MQPILDFLQANPVQFLATVGLDGKPKVQPFQFMLEDGGRLWFCTGNKKDVYAELQQQPWLELSASSPENMWLRLAARAVFADDEAIKNRIVAQNELVRSIYKTGDNPDFAVFYLAEGSATLSDFSGKPPQTFTF